MSKSQVLNAYKQTDQNYVNGIETPHGRIKILYETIIDNLNKLLEKHPKTDFVSYGKCINALNILSSSLDMEAGKDLAKNLSELYAYCSNRINEYLEDKSNEKLLIYFSFIFGMFVIIYALYLKKFLLVTVIFLSELSFTFYYPPIVAYRFGSLILLTYLCIILINNLKFKSFFK